MIYLFVYTGVKSDQRGMKRHPSWHWHGIDLDFAICLTNKIKEMWSRDQTDQHVVAYILTPLSNFFQFVLHSQDGLANIHPGDVLFLVLALVRLL